MKLYSQFGLLALAACLAIGCINEEEKSASPMTTATAAGSETMAADTSNYTTIAFAEMVKNLGTIAEGQKLEVVFSFTNTGTKPLVIQSATPSCGCTVPEKPEQPIMPGQAGQIKAVFDSKGRPGANHKTINVVANTQGGTSHILEFNVEVAKATEAK